MNLLVESASSCASEVTLHTSPDRIPQKDVVLLLCKFIHLEERSLESKDVSRSVKYEVRKCPNGPLCKSPQSHIIFRHKTGFANPYKHLVTCVGKGDVNVVLQLYRDEMDRKTKQSCMSDHFTPTAIIPSDKDIELFEWIQMITHKNWPLWSVEDDMYRRALKHRHKFSSITVRRVILAMVPIIEQVISVEMKEAGYGSILHDGWTKFGQHYVGLFATYNKLIDVIENNRKTQRKVPTSVLLAMSPMSNVKDEESTDGDPEEDTNATTFTAEVHAKFFRDMFSRYDHLSLSDWTICQTADNVSTNKKVAKLLGIPHIPCSNHLLNSETQYMISNAPVLANVLDSIHETMVGVKGSIKNTAVLRSLTNLRPEIGNATRWTGWGRMLRKYIRIRPCLLEATENEDANIPMNCGLAFKRKAERQALMFEDINAVAISMQKKLYTVSACQNNLNDIIEESDEGRLQENSPWYRNRMGHLYIGTTSFKLPDPHFVSGLIKIQNNDTASMTFAEKGACEKLQNTDVIVQDNTPQQITTLADRMKARSKKRKAGEIEDKASSYKNADFICGSAAEVERLWSICKYILSNLRTNLTPIFFESLVYCKINDGYWDIKNVQDAYTHVLRETQNERLRKMVAEDVEYMGGEDDVE